MIFEQLGKPKNLALSESLFALGNGYLGVRSAPEEAEDKEQGSIRGSYLNGVYERVPMHHAEMAYGFPTMIDQQPRICDTQSLHIYLDGVLIKWEDPLEDYRQRLDMKQGLYRRSYRWQHPQGDWATLRFLRMASFARRELFVYQLEIDYPGKIEVKSWLKADVENVVDPDDPRVGKVSRLLQTLQLEEKGDDLFCLQQTLRSKQSIACRVLHRSEHASRLLQEHLAIGQVFEAKDHFKLEKLVLFSDSLRQHDPSLHLEQLSTEIKKLPLEELFAEQEAYLESFWEDALIEVQGDDDTAITLQWQMYQLLQSTARDALSNISAKGLSGEGYEGHYFWDTEVYILPLWQLLKPELARTLMDYRIRILPEAQAQARNLGHEQGACYAWRTISGIECSGYFPAGSAQYHLSGDVAFSMYEYFTLTQDRTFLFSGALDVILETARLWLNIGNFNESGFHLHDVTGPDEYSAIVSDNYYTNRLAQVHLQAFLQLFHELQGEEELTSWQERMDVTDEELDLMKKAAEQILLPYSEKLQIDAQDALFLEKPSWPQHRKLRPLLLHYHPLTIYRHQVLKQADTVLSYLLREEEDSLERMRRSFNYYEAITTHDSSLSPCIYGMMAARLGYQKKAWDYFCDSLYLDLHNTHNNSHHGLHMANVAGSLLFVLKGFAGLRISPTLTLRPMIPEAWKSYRFRFHYRGRKIQVEIDEDVKLLLLEGDPLEIRIQDDYYILEETLHLKGVVR